MSGAAGPAPARSYLHIGCGLSAPATWTNFDASAALRLQRIPVIGPLLTRGRARWPEHARWGNAIAGLPVSPASCRAVYCSHTLEHFALDDFRRVLRNVHGWLAPGGIFRLVVPDLERLARVYLDSSDDEAALAFMRDASLGLETRRRGVVALLQAWLGNWQHLSMWDEKSLTKELVGAGFVGVRRAEYGDSTDPRFGDVEVPVRWTDCLGMECRKADA